MALTVTSLEILRHQSVSNALDCRAGKIVRIGMPNDWTAAPLTFQVSPDGVIYLDLYHVQVTTGAFVPFEVVTDGDPEQHFVLAARHWLQRWVAQGSFRYEHTPCQSAGPSQVHVRVRVQYLVLKPAPGWGTFRRSAGMDYNG